ncbi:hypothetical protein CHT97_09070 [Lacticaseibacillus chiayiensis]|nr:hypothetical protein CHT97_09070 [Lacticaseibacillus chiayiensis]
MKMNDFRSFHAAFVEGSGGKEEAGVGSESHTNHGSAYFFASKVSQRLILMLLSLQSLDIHR